MFVLIVAVLGLSVLCWFGDFDLLLFDVGLRLLAFGFIRLVYRLRLIAFCYLQLLDLLRALLVSSGFSGDLRLRFVL